MSRGLTRAERLEEMKRLYVMRAWTDIEMAQRLDVDRTTVYKDRIALESEYPFLEEDTGHWRIDRNRFISEIKLNLHEALALYLAARRASRQTRVAQPHVAAAVEKLAVALRQPMTTRLVQAAAGVMQQTEQPERVRILETLAQGWVSQQKVRITHRGLRATRSHTGHLSPYLIEPSLLGDGTYVIGYSDVLQQVATYKLERIESATLTGETFVLPQGFDERELLQHAWGIWFGEGEPVEVKLRFRPGPALRRLKESIWHPSQNLADLEDGACIWSARVAEWRELVPWVRGWGADAEVLAPEAMRAELEREAQRLAELYNIAEARRPPLHHALWAKFNRETYETHPLPCHLLDVAQVTLAIWNEVLTDRVRTRLAEPLGLNAEQAGRLLAFWAALHDIGKASPAFQRKVKSLEGALSAAGLPFPKLFSQEKCFHATVSTRALEQLLQSETGMGLRPAKRIAAALGGHHGAWPAPGAAERIKDDQFGGPEWDHVRQELFRELVDILKPPQLTAWIADRCDENRFLTLFSGLVSVADWIGSTEKYFRYARLPVDLGRYVGQAASQAREALADLGWLDWRPPTESRRFEELFPFPPSPMQQVVVELAERLQGPSLVLIEAPTGKGKTEAALYLADTWAWAEQQAGMYVAMPTMATSNQMHGRVTAMLHKRYGEDTVEPLLVHSQARWITEAAPPEITSDDERAGASAQAMSWFLPRKRSLLAPFGVGTVDQSLISVLQTRHFFVRLFGLSHKTVVFDEVHAYDTYMSTLFQHLLAWLRAVDASVILLSATLPAETRCALVHAYAGEGVAVPEASYPSITWASGTEVGAVALPPFESRWVALEWISRDPQAIVSELRESLCEGGCAAVICNTVARSQEVYLAIRDAGIVSPDELVLFHARTPFAWRDQVEREVLSRFGKEGKRPQKAIVVATQVIEQSLDLDFDRHDQRSGPDRPHSATARA